MQFQELCWFLIQFWRFLYKKLYSLCAKEMFLSESCFCLSFSSAQLQPTLGLENFINLSAAMILAFGLMFQFPLAVLICVKFGLVRVSTLKLARPYIIVGILILAAIFTPPDIVSQLLLGVPTWLLFEAGLFAASLIEKKSEKPL